MPKVTLNSIGSRYGSIDALNDNFDAIEAAIENTLSLDGTSPNAMEAALDMNSNAILNASTIYAGSVVIAGQSLEPGSASNVSTVQVSEFTATAGQTSFSVSPFTPSSTGVIMEVNGVTLPTSSISVTGSVVSFPALQAGDEAVIRTFTREVGGSNNASDIAFLQTGAATTRTVQSKLRDVFSVKDYAVVGDGTTNDTAAFQVAVDAVAAAGGGDLYIPNGTYSLDTINMKEGVRLVGQGKGAILQQRTSSLVYLFQVNSVSNVGFVNLTIDVNNGAGADGLGTVAIFHRGVTAAANNFLAKDCKFINGLIRPYLDFRSSLASRGVFILDNEFIGKATLTTATAPQTQTTQAIRFLCVGGCGLWEIRGNTSKYCGLFLQTRHVSTQATLSRTLASGAISITTTAATTLYLDTEGAAATDDLDTITNTTPTNGQEITLFATNDARDVVVRHNTGNISLSGGTNITLGNGVSFVTLRWNSTSSTWVQVEQFDSVVVSDNMYTDALDDPNVSTSPYELFCITGLTVTGNTIRSGGRGFNGSYVKSASYTGNVAYDQTKYFFEMVVCDGVTISGNTAYNCKTFINDTSPVSGSSNITIVGNSIVGGSIGEVGYDANTFTNVITMMPTRTYSHWRIADNIFSGQQWTTSTIRIDGVATDFEVLNNQFIQSEETQKPRAILVNAGSNIRIVGNVIKRSVNITNATESGNSTYAFIELTTGSGGSDIRVEDNLIRWTGTDARTGGNNTGVIGIGGNLAAAALAKVFVRRNSLLGTFTAPLRLQITSGDTVVEDNDLSGATGAVSFNSAVTFPGVVSVKDFGAKGDGTTDDTVAVQAAVNACNGKTLLVPSGTYLVGKIDLVSNITIVGEGEGTIFRLKNAQDTNLFDAASRSNLTLRSLVLDGNKANQTLGAVARCFYALDSSDIRLEDLIVKNAADHGAFISTGATTNPLSDSLRIWADRCKFIDNGTTTAGGNGGSGFVATCRYLWATDCYSEGNILSGFKFTGAYISAKGCYAIDNDSGGFSTGFDSVTEEGSAHVYENCYALNNGNGTDGGDGFRHQGQVDKIVHRDCFSIGNAWSGISLNASTTVRPIDIDIYGGTILNNGQNFTASSTVAGSGISLLSTASSPNVPAYVRLHGVTITDTQGTKTQEYGIRNEDGTELYVGEGCRLDGNEISSFYNAGTIVTNIRMSPSIIDGDFVKRTTVAGSVTGSIVETDLQTITIPANTFVPGQRFSIRARGSASGTNGTKSFRIYFGNSNQLFSSQVAGDQQEWFVDGVVEIAGATSQKVSFTGVEVGGSTTSGMLSSSSNINTAIICKITGLLGNSGDTATCSSFFFEPIY